MSGRNYKITDLTVNICTVDRHDYLMACIESLLQTTPPGAPLTIVFNGTPEPTRRAAMKMAEAWQGPTRFEHIEQTVPLDESHNIALGLVETRLVNFMGDDDVVLGPRLHKILRAFNELEPEPAAVTTYARRVAGDAFNPKSSTIRSLGPTSIAEWEEWRDEGKIFEMVWPGAVFRTDELRAVGGFEARFNQSADNRIFTQLAQRAPVVALTDDQFGYRIHQGALSTGNWKVQNRHVRYVAACHEAHRAGLEEPTYEAFLAAESSAPWRRRVSVGLRDRSRMHFRRGGALMLQGQWVRASANLVASVAIWPPAFVGKVRDQI